MDTNDPQDTAARLQPASAQAITASMLYDVAQCPHRLALDLRGDPEERDPTSAFVRMLWERGNLHEAAIVGSLAREPGFVDLAAVPVQEREARTLAAMAGGASLIHRGRIRADGLLGEPDLLRRDETGRYVPGDVKSGAATSRDTGEDGCDQPKQHYAIQLGLYVDVLARIGHGAEGRRGFIIDVDGEEVAYDLAARRGPKSPDTLWDKYEWARDLARGIVEGRADTRGAYAAQCKLCHWYTRCLRELSEAGDPTLVPGLGRSVRDALSGRVDTISELASIDPSTLAVGGAGTSVRGLGLGRLVLLKERAQLITSAAPRPYLRAPVSIPPARRELFFDIEADPMRRITYLHGFVERIGGDRASERFMPFFADDPDRDGERQAFAAAWAYIAASQPCMTYFYSKYERTAYRELQARYPDVCSRADVEEFFGPGRSVDLYGDIVVRATEWPTRDHSIKTLARYLGFCWRDTDPSGAASIEWYDRWTATGDPAVRQRILDYNEDDCRATRVLLDAIRGLRPKNDTENTGVESEMQA